MQADVYVYTEMYLAISAFLRAYDQCSGSGILLCGLVLNYSPFRCEVFLFADLHEFWGKPVGFERQ